MPPDSLAISWLWQTEIKDLLARSGVATTANIELPGFIPARLEVCHHTPYASDVRVRWISRSLSTNMAGTPVGLHGRWYHAFSYSVPLTVWSIGTRLGAQRIHSPHSAIVRQARPPGSPHPRPPWVRTHWAHTTQVFLPLREAILYPIKGNRSAPIPILEGRTSVHVGA